MCAPYTRAVDLVRRLWVSLEHLHAVTYFAPECHAAYEAIGLRGFWRGYFAGRAAPLGAVGSGVVVATFFGFHPDFVARAVPSVWSIATPDDAIAARLQGADNALARILGPRDVAEAANQLRRALDRCEPYGRPLFAANAALGWPDEPREALWHGATLFREHRGDAHVAALTAAGIGPCEAHVLQVAFNGAPLDSIKPYRGWSEDDWTIATTTLVERGWLDPSGSITDGGRRERETIEDVTDRLSMPATDALLDALRPIVANVHEIPYPNPIGLPPPD